MSSKAKLLSAVLAAAMTMGLLAGCGAKPAHTSSSAAAPTQLVIDQPVFNPIPKDWQAVQDAVSKITLQKINATVKINLIDMGRYPQQFNLIMSSGQPVDIVYIPSGPGTVPWTSLAAEGDFAPLNKLLDQYGQGIKQAVAPPYLRCGQVSGAQYAIPLLCNFAQQEGFTMRKDLVDKYHIDLSKIKSYQDMTQVFAVIKKNQPSMYPLAVNQMGTALMPFWYDQMGDSLGVLPNWNNNLKLVDLYETPQYAQMCKIIRSWYLKGYIQPDAATSHQFSWNLLKSGQAFAIDGGPYPGWLSQIENSTGRQMVSVPIGPAAVTTFNVAHNMYAIPISSKHPQKAMQLLNLLYTNKDIVNLIDNGIPGKDYVKKSNDVIAYPPGVSPADRYPGIGGQGITNLFLSYVYSNQNPNLYSNLATFIKDAVHSKALGFSFDPSGVKTQYAAVQNVIAQYVPSLENGAVNPSTVLPEFIRKLKAAGIDQIIAAKQKQLDQWAKTNHIQTK